MSVINTVYKETPNYARFFLDDVNEFLRFLKKAGVNYYYCY